MDKFWNCYVGCCMLLVFGYGTRICIESLEGKRVTCVVRLFSSMVVILSYLCISFSMDISCV